MNQAWNIYAAGLRKKLIAQNIQINGFVMMSNHFHLLCSSTKPEIEFAFSDLGSYLNGAIQDDFNIHIEEIFNFTNYINVLKYIYRNPVNAGLVERVEDYRYSSLYHVLGKTKDRFPIIDNMNVIHDLPRRLKWLNSPESTSLWEVYRYQ